MGNLPNTKDKPKSKTAITRIINGYEYQWCRGTQHIWTHGTSESIEIVERGLACIRYNCSQCGGERLDYVSLHTGNLTRRIYRMPQGYRLKGFGDALPKKNQWRKSLLAGVS